MKVWLYDTVANANGNWPAGVHDLDEKTAKRFIESGRAKPLDGGLESASRRTPEVAARTSKPRAK